MLTKIISGGQTGVDRAALDWAMTHGYAVGGWCPKGRRAEDGVIDARYPLVEADSRKYRQRTRLNVRDSDGTLIVNHGAPDGGTLATEGFAKQLRKPCLVLQLDAEEIPEMVGRITAWLQQAHIATLNVAGPRESKRPGIYCASMVLLMLWHPACTAFDASFGNRMMHSWRSDDWP